jgi:hypothetical protein
LIERLNDLTARLGVLEAENAALRKENATLRSKVLESVGGDENPRIDGVRRNGGEISTAAMLSEPPSVPMIVKRSPESFALRA